MIIIKSVWYFVLLRLTPILSAADDYRTTSVRRGGAVATALETVDNVFWSRLLLEAMSL